LRVSSIATISGGQIIKNIEAYNRGDIAISGGSIRGNLNARDNSSVYISGGQINGSLNISSDSIVIIEGMNFVLDGHSVLGTIINPLNETNYGHLTGTYLNGSPLDIHLEMQPGTSITFVPEPATLLLLGLGAVMLRKKD